MIEVIALNIFLLFIGRTLYLLVFKSKTDYSYKKHVRTLIVIGSGGHTTEMTRQVQKLNPDLYNPRLYVMADSDTSSKTKITEAESLLQDLSETEYNITQIPRSRSVNQSYITSILTTIYSTLKCIPVIVSFKPDLVLCNGPGTCIPICIISFLMNILFFSNTTIIFIESICRVKTLSLSGKILIYIANQVIVQWPHLHRKYPKTVYIGRLI